MPFQKFMRTIIVISFLLKLIRCEVPPADKNHEKKARRQFVLKSSLFLITGTATVGCITGARFYQKSLLDMRVEYDKAYTTAEATELGNKLEAGDSIANTLYVFGESGIFLTSGLLVWTIIDLFKYIRIKKSSSSQVAFMSYITGTKNSFIFAYRF